MGKANWWDDPSQSTTAGGADAIEGWIPGETVFQGTYLRTREGKLSPLLDFTDEAGKPRTFGCPAILERKMEGVEIGSFVRIACTGEVQVKGQASPAKTFTVHVRRVSE